MKWVGLNVFTLVVHAGFCASHVFGLEGDSICCVKCEASVSSVGFAGETIFGDKFSPLFAFWVMGPEDGTEQPSVVFSVERNEGSFI